MVMNYGYNNPYQQQRVMLKMYPVSNIMEANATYVDGLDPIFFYNRAENVIYKKQIDGTGAAPIQVYKLDTPPVVPVIPDYINDLKASIDEIKNLIKPIEDEDKKGKK